MEDLSINGNVDAQVEVLPVPELSQVILRELLTFDQLALWNTTVGWRGGEEGGGGGMEWCVCVCVCRWEGGKRERRERERREKGDRRAEEEGGERWRKVRSNEG